MTNRELTSFRVGAEFPLADWPEAVPRLAPGVACLESLMNTGSWLDAILIPFIAYSREETDNGVIRSFYSSQCKTNITFAVASQPSGTRAPR